MHRIRNRKRLVNLAVAFMLVFVVGAAFALTPGALDIRGNVNVAAPDDLYVVWMQPFAPSWIDVGTVNHSVTLADGADGRSDQVALWTINFATAGTAVLDITAFNNAAVPAIIAGGAITWLDADGDPITGGELTALLTSFGLSASFIDGSDDDFRGTLPAGVESAPLGVQVVWEGDTPAGFTAAAGSDYGFAATLAITFTYGPT
jgi:hypothetical protein